MDSLKALDLDRPIKEADISQRLPREELAYSLAHLPQHTCPGRPTDVTSLMGKKFIRRCHALPRKLER
jgi:hypothetical protein